MKVACTVWRRGKEGDNIEFLPIPMLESIGGTKASTVGVVNPYRYRGYRFDNETGLYYLQNRYYNPEWGRFVNADALAGQAGELLSHNIFTYCKNNPINMSDDTGFRPAFDSVKKENAYYDWKENKKKHIRRSNKHRATMRITPSRGTRLEDPNTDGSGYMGNNVGGGSSGIPSAGGTAEDVVIKEVSELGSNKINHILQSKHLWGKVVNDPNDWSQVSKLMSKVMQEGVEGLYKNVFSKTLDVLGHTVEVTYTKLSDVIIKISDGWVRPR